MRITPPDRKSIILVIDSNPEMNQFIAQCLVDDYHVISLDGRQGLEKVRTKNPATMVIDAKMFAANSDAMVALLSKGAKGMDIPILLLADTTDEE